MKVSEGPRVSKAKAKTNKNYQRYAEDSLDARLAQVQQEAQNVTTDQTVVTPSHIVQASRGMHHSQSLDQYPSFEKSHATGSRFLKQQSLESSQVQSSQHGTRQVAFAPSSSVRDINMLDSTNQV